MVNSTNSTNSMNSIVVSVIVTTKNEEKNLANCLRSIINSTNSMNPLNPFVIEIIVVDNNSTDNTVEIAKQFTDNVYNKDPQRATQLNFGVSKAKSKYILYPDADMILSEKVITECVDKCENEDYIALYIPEKIIGNRFWIRVRDFERSFYNATCIDAVRFVRRDKFSGIGGFDENLIFGADDWDFDRRIKEVGDVSIIESPLYHNERRFNLRKYLRRKGYYSKSLDGYVEKWGKDDPIIKKQLGAWYRLFGVFIENEKRKKIVRHPLLTLGMYLLRVMVGVQYLCRRSKIYRFSS